MKRSLSLFLAILIFIPSVAWGSNVSIHNPKADIRYMEEVLRYIQENHPFDLDQSDLIYGGIKGMLQAVDPHSNYYTPEEAKQLNQTISGEFSGIGVYIKEKDGYINIEDTIKGQPAEKAGLKKNDLIIAVDGQDIKNFGTTKASLLIKGPVGSQVKIKVKRGDQVLVIQVTRDSIMVKNVESEILEEDIGYIKLAEFLGEPTKEMNNALKVFDSKGIKKVILDLRDNPGGYLHEAISISKLFITRGPIVHIREKGKALLTHTSTMDKAKYKLVVLVNENSASASEIVAGAVKDRGAGSLVGTKTYGKGTVQSMMTLTDGSMIKLTIAEYLTPNKTSIHGIGIEPDYKVENRLDSKEDLQLKKAIQILK